jgi:hypothetical protein
MFSACRRRAPRERVTLAGSAMSIARSRSIAVSDLSTEGVQIGGRDLPSLGEDVLLVVGSTDRMGKIVWRHGDRCGIRLDEPFRIETIIKMKQEATWESVVGWQ